LFNVTSLPASYFVAFPSKKDLAPYTLTHTPTHTPSCRSCNNLRGCSPGSAPPVVASKLTNPFGNWAAQLDPWSLKCLHCGLTYVSLYGSHTHTYTQAQAMACIMSLAALGELCRSAPVSARVATLKGLPAALAVALRVHSMDMCLYAAGRGGCCSRRAHGPMLVA